MNSFNKTRFITILVVLFISFHVTAQKNFVRGFVVKNNSDTLKGFVNYLERNQNPSSIEFKDDLDAVSRWFRIKELTYVNINDIELYERFIVSISMNPTALSLAQTSSGEINKIDTVLLKILEKGRNVSLYSYSDNVKVRYYICTYINQSPTELFYGVSIKDSKVSHIRSYANQLILLANQSGHLTERLKNEISTADYRHSDILKIVRKINGNEEKKLNPVTQKRQHGYFYGGLGLDISTLFYTGDIDLARNPTKHYSALPYVTLGYDFLNNPNIGRLIIRGELLIQPAKYQASTSSIGVVSSESTQNVSFINTSLGVNVLYNLYQKDKFKIFMGGGLRASLPLNVANHYTEKSTIANFTTVNNKSNYPQLSNVFLSYLLKAGVVLNKKVEVYVTYFFKSRITDNYVNFSGYVQPVQIGVNYHLRKNLLEDKN